MRLVDFYDEARRVMVLCTVCGYCDGYCDVFHSAKLRRNLHVSDMHHLANLCHNCRNCRSACQYAPPHDFAIDVPRTLAEVRRRTYRDYAWPRPLGQFLHGNALLLLFATVLGMALGPVLTMLGVPGDILYGRHHESGAFYAIIPWRAIALAAGTSLAWSLTSLTISLIRFQHSTRHASLTPVLKALPTALRDILTLRNLGGGDLGCSDHGGSFSELRRRFHHAVFYGFLLCFASTAVATVYQDLLEWSAPYPVFSVPVVLGCLGGFGLIVGSAGLIWIKTTALYPYSAGEEGEARDFALPGSLIAVAASGLVLLILRGTSAMGFLLSCHLGAVIGFFLALPYSKFVHGPYRVIAVLHAVQERRKKV